MIVIHPDSRCMMLQCRPVCYWLGYLVSAAVLFCLEWYLKPEGGGMYNGNQSGCDLSVIKPMIYIPK